MTLVNYISNHALSQSLGGWDGVSASIYQALSERFQVKFVGPVNPGNDYRAKVLSKLRRSAPGDEEREVAPRWIAARQVVSSERLRRAPSLSDLASLQRS